MRQREKPGVFAWVVRGEGKQAYVHAVDAEGYMYCYMFVDALQDRADLVERIMEQELAGTLDEQVGDALCGAVWREFGVE